MKRSSTEQQGSGGRFASRAIAHWFRSRTTRESPGSKALHNRRLEIKSYVAVVPKLAPSACTCLVEQVSVVEAKAW